jgi:soluble epoxide hydrolase / lipid-phosphate phosphatase
MSEDFPLQQIQVDTQVIAYRESGPLDGQPIVLVHGWPQTSWAWRHQLAELGARGYRVIAPDLRGTGGSTVFKRFDDYALRHHVGDLIALVDAFEIDQATWVGHDWGAPAVWSAARHHPERFAAGGSLSTPYDTLERGFERVTSFVRRDVYPETQYPAGQMDYYRFYAEQFEDAQKQFEADIAAFFSIVLRGDRPGQQNVVWPTATVRRRGGWFDGGPAPAGELDPTVISARDLERFVEDYSRTGFFGVNSFYMNDDDNRAFVEEAGRNRVEFPALLVIGRHDYVNDAAYSELASPMRELCDDLDIREVEAGHWIHQERPAEVSDAIDDLAQRGAERR